MPPHLSGRIVYHPPLPRMRNQLVDRAPMGTTVKVPGFGVPSDLSALYTLDLALRSKRARLLSPSIEARPGDKQLPPLANPQPSQARAGCVRDGALHDCWRTCRPSQVLAFYERPLWRASPNVSQCVTFVLDPHAFTARGDRSVDSVYDVSPPGGPGALASFLW